MQKETAYNFSQIPILTEQDKERFWSKVAITANPDKCWEWKAFVHRSGYGAVRIGGRKGKTVYSHRLAYFIANNIDPNLCVCHSCDNRTCANPNHLWLGTIADNNKDRDLKGRRDVNGERIGTSKLTTSQVLEIKKAHTQGVKNTISAKKYNVSEVHIGRILSKKAWGHL